MNYPQASISVDSLEPDEMRLPVECGALGLAGFLAGFAIAYLFFRTGHRRRPRAIINAYAPFARAAAEARRAAVLGRTGISAPRFIAPPRVAVVAPRRVRLLGAVHGQRADRACRFCGLSLDEGDHAACRHGVLDG
jgi:hypothetical protein